MIAAKNYAGAKAKLNEAEAAASTPDDHAIINQFKNAISISSADPNTPGGAKAKFAQDYSCRQVEGRDRRRRISEEEQRVRRPVPAGRRPGLLQGPAIMPAA